MQPLHVQPLALILLAGIGIAYYFLIYRPSLTVPRVTVTLDDVPRVFDLLKAAGGEGTFAQFQFGTNGEPPPKDDPLYLGFSIERGRTGLDWVLLEPRNLAAKERVAEFLRRRGYEVAEREMNEVPYLRVEGGELVSLCQALLVDLFGVTPTQKMDLLTEGFDWPA